MDEGFFGEIRLVAFNYDPEGWVSCDGRKLPTKNYQPLYALIGNVYGGDTNNFQVPTLAAPVKGMRYIICCSGIWPNRP